MWKRKVCTSGLVVVILLLTITGCLTQVEPEIVEVEKTVVVEKEVVVEREKEVVVEKTVEVERVVEVEKVVEVVVTPPVKEETPNLNTPGKLTLGVFNGAGVMEWQAGQPIGGFVPVLLEEIAKKLELEPVYQVYDFAALIPALQAGRVDATVGKSITQSRAQIFYFGKPYLFGAESLSVRPGFTISSWEEAKARDLTLATQVGFWYIGEWEKMGIKLHTFDSTDACLLDVVRGGSDGCAVGTFSLIYRQATMPDSPVSQLDLQTMSGPLIKGDSNSLATRKDNPALARAINQAIVELWREGLVEGAIAEVMTGAPYELLIKPAEGHAYYQPGPWEPGAVPPASEVYLSVQTVSDGQLTVGVVGDSALLRLDGNNLVGPEAEILRFAAGKFGLELIGVAANDGASAVREGSVDLIAGALPATEEESFKYWQTIPIGFNPDYIYVKPGGGGAYPGFTSWEDVAAVEGKLVVVTGNPRIREIEQVDVEIIEYSNAIDALQAVADGEAQGFVGSTVDFLASVSQDQALIDAGIGFLRNKNLFSYGEAYVWGVKAGNDRLIDSLDQAITAAWHEGVIFAAYSEAFPGANITAILAPGPSAIGTAYGAGTANDFDWRSIWMPGPWLQTPGWVK